MVAFVEGLGWDPNRHLCAVLDNTDSTLPDYVSGVNTGNTVLHFRVEMQMEAVATLVELFICRSRTDLKDTLKFCMASLSFTLRS